MSDAMAVVRGSELAPDARRTTSLAQAALPGAPWPASCTNLCTRIHRHPVRPDPHRPWLALDRARKHPGSEQCPKSGACLTAASKQPLLLPLK